MKTPRLSINCLFHRVRKGGGRRIVLASVRARSSSCAWIKLTSIFAVLHYATRLVARYNSLVEYHERNRDAREVQLAQSDERLQQSQVELDGRHGDISMKAEHWNTTNDSLDRTLTNVEHGLHNHHQRNSL
jgi:hypothetical protein